MNPTALALLVAAATLHTAWNLVLKGVGPRAAFTWWTLMVGFFLFLPVLVWQWPIPTRVWPYVLASAAVEVAYFLSLARAYNRADFSLVYPVARGAAPALLVIWAMLFLGERPRLGGFAGLAILFTGLFMVGATGKRASGAAERTVNAQGIMAALTVALCISVYSAIDAAAIRIMQPAGYNVLVLGLSGLLAAPIMFQRFGPSFLGATWREHRGRVVACALLMFFAYMMVLRAYTMAPASYAAAIREVGIVFAALIGWRWLGEGFGGVRTAGAGLIFAGILLIAVAG